MPRFRIGVYWCVECQQILSSVRAMQKAEGWQRLGELSTMFQKFRRMYVHREVDEESPTLWSWRRELVEFLKVGSEGCGDQMYSIAD